MIEGVGQGKNSYVPQTAAGGGDVAKLEQQKNALKEELKRVKEDDKLKPDAKKRKISELEKKLQKIEEAIQKASNESEEKNETKASDVKKTEEEDMDEKMRNNKLEGAGTVLDTYA